MLVLALIVDSLQDFQLIAEEAKHSLQTSGAYFEILKKNVNWCIHSSIQGRPGEVNQWWRLNTTFWRHAAVLVFGLVYLSRLTM